MASLAMSLFTSGRITPEQAVELSHDEGKYLGAVLGIKSMLANYPEPERLHNSISPMYSELAIRLLYAYLALECYEGLLIVRAEMEDMTKSFPESGRIQEALREANKLLDDVEKQKKSNCP